MIVDFRASTVCSLVFVGLVLTGWLLQELAVTPEEDTPSSSQTTDLPCPAALDSLEPVSAIETDRSSSPEPEIVPVVNGDAPRRRLPSPTFDESPPRRRFPSPTFNGDYRPRKSASASDVFGAREAHLGKWRQDNHVQVIPIKSPTTKDEEPVHDFGPLPPSPVEEDEEDEYTDIVEARGRGKADTLPEPIYRVREPVDQIR